MYSGVDIMREYPMNTNYLVDNKGNIYSKRFKKKLTPKVNWDGYHRIQIWKNQKCKFVSWHRVVAQTWIDNPENKPYVNHKDGNKSNNHPSNLEWVTQKENLEHAVENGWVTNATRSSLGEVNHFSKDGELIKTYDSIRSVCDDLELEYFYVHYRAKKKPGTRLDDGSYFEIQ